jgi:cell division protein FtsW
VTEQETWRRPDFTLLATVAVLVVLGLDMVYSASYVIAHNDPSYGSDTYFLVRQGIWTAVGIVCMLVCQAVDYHRWRRVTVPAMAGVVLLLVAVLATHLSHSAYGAQRWLQFGPLPAIEPSEFAKLGLILYYADWLSRRHHQMGSLMQSALPFGLTVSGICALVILQPDLGTSFVIAGTAICLFFIAGADVRHLLLGMALGGAGLLLVVFGAGYRSQRIAAFLNPASDPLGVGWNITQAQIALGSGGIFGRGLGASVQKFYYLPNAQTDAIFAVIGEELGLVGTFGVIALFALLALRGYRIAMRAPDTYGALLATGVTSWLVLQAFVNVAVITATIPFTGIPLPFISFGGSSMIVSLVALGIVLNVSRQSVADSRSGPAGRGGTH